MKRTVGVKLLQPLPHAGHTLKPGTRMTMDERRAARLVEQGVVEVTTTEVPALLKPPAPIAEDKPVQAAHRRGCCGGFVWK